MSEKIKRSQWENTAVLYVCIRTIRMSTCFVYIILSECIEVQEDLFVTFGQCTRILTEIKKEETSKMDING